MVGDPVTLAAVRLLSPLFKACEKVYETWQLTQTFGNDLFKLECMLDAQYARLSQISSRRLDQLAVPPDPNDEFDPAWGPMYSLLLCISAVFEQSEKLIQDVTRTRAKLQKPAPKKTSPPRSQCDVPVIEAGPASGSTGSSPPAPSNLSLTATNRIPEERSPASSLSEPSNIVAQTPGQSRLSEPSITQRIKSFLLETFRRKASSKEDCVRPPAKAAKQVIGNMLSTLTTTTTPKAEIPVDLNKRIDFDRKVEWALSDKEALEGFVKDIIGFVDALDHLTREKAGQGLMPYGAPEGMYDTLLEDTVDKTQTALERLHRSLKSNNTKNRRILLQLADDYEKLGREFSEQNDYLFGDMHELLEGHAGPTAIGQVRESSLVVAEVAAGALGSRFLYREEDEIAQDLDRSARKQREPVLDKDTDTIFEFLGGISPPRGSMLSFRDVHCLFRDRIHRWQSHATLAEALRKGTLAKQMAIHQRIELALIIVNAYLYLARVRHMCAPITLQAFKYYDLKESDLSTEQLDLLDNLPYIDFGYGQARVVLIGGPSRTRSSHPIFDLGISLVQIGRCLVHEYDTGAAASLSEARTWAQASLKSLDCSLPMGFTEVVQDCLEYVPRDIPGQYERNLKTQNAFLLDKVRRLHDLQSRFHSASRAGAMVPDTRDD